MLTLVAGLVIVALFLLHTVTDGGENPYLGILMYMVVPPFLFVGLALIPFGMWREWRRWKRSGSAEHAWPVVDFGRSTHRNAAVVFVVGTIVFITASAVGSYEAFHYTESVAFCGTTCHSVMEPEHTTYQNSAHARVTCTSCHVGSGAGWYVKSKLSGAYQVYSVNFDKYPRPIPTPIESLRPAQGTCETCHWPQHMYGAQQRKFPHFKYDEANTAWPVNLLLKVGGGDPATGQSAGIHWHMNVGVEVDFIHRDEERHDIPWIKVTDKKSGSVRIYQSTESPLSAEEIAKATPRRMDCMDCHNRPAHHFLSPDESVDNALLTGKLKTDLPYIKKVAVEALAAEYADRNVARTSIENALLEFYRTEHAEVWSTREPDVRAAVAATQEIYGENFFPEMKARWDAYPENLGHFSNIGCMRCHDGKHVAEDGVAINTSCTACHAILAQGSGEQRQVASTEEGLPFVHPEDIGDMWMETGCYECHKGTQP